MKKISQKCAAVLFVAICLLGTRSAIAAEWVSVGGNVYFGETPLCALVLINGQSQFSCDGTGRYDMQVPLDGNGMVTVQVFADGFAPFKQILTPEQASAYQVNMIRVDQGRSFIVNASYAPSEREGWFVVSGTVNSGGTPVCALILANGQKMFSCNENLGNFFLEVPLDQDGNITLMIFAAGFTPYKQILPAQANPIQIANTSYSNFKSIGLTPQKLPAPVNNARAYGDFFRDGQLGYFSANLTYNPSNTLEAATPSTFSFWERQNDGAYTLNTQILSESNGCIHPRKAIVADFNGDEKPDIFVACHGYDAAPHPGEKNKVVLSQPNNSYQIQDASPDIGFFHGASAADLNGDQQPDVVVTGLYPQPVAVYINRSGSFEREVVSRFPAILEGKPYFSVELIDVDEDGAIDILLGGHEWEGAETVVLLNPGTNDFSAVVPIVISPIPGEGVVLDFTITGSHADRTIWILRTSGGDGTFYESRTIQRVDWTTLTYSIPLMDRPARWFPWTIPTKVEGENVISSDDVTVGVLLRQ
jgi:hypothetical protein